MQLVGDTLKRLCAQRGLSLKKLLATAGVSRTAYYSLLRKESILPRSVLRLAGQLGVRPARLLHDETRAVARVRALQRQTETVMRAHPSSDRDIVLRTLMNLQLQPIDRLRRALIRAPRTRHSDV